MMVEQTCSKPSRRADSNAMQTSDSECADRSEFPSARYFQIHFEYLEDLLGEARQSLESLRQQVAEFRQNTDDSPADKAGGLARTSAGPSIQCDDKRRGLPRKVLQPFDSAVGAEPEG